MPPFCFVIVLLVPLKLTNCACVLDVGAAFPDSHAPLFEQKLAPVFTSKDRWCQSDGSTSLSFFNVGRVEALFGNGDLKVSGKNPFSGRKWTNILLAANVL